MTTTHGLELGVAESSRPVVPAHHLVTHGVVVGMTGSGKTGLVTVMVEDASAPASPSSRST